MKYLVNTLTDNLRQADFPSDVRVTLRFYREESGYVGEEIKPNLQNLHKHIMQLKSNKAHSISAVINGIWLETILILV
jgi:hypothetical protein